MTKKNKKHKVNFYIEYNLYEWLLGHAMEHGITMTDVISDTLKSLRKVHESINSEKE